jgi:hypothetical protein
MRYVWSVARYDTDYSIRRPAVNISAYLSAYVNSNATTRGPSYFGAPTLAIPSALLTRGYTYAIVLGLTNWMGQTTSSSPIYVAVMGDKVLPVLKVLTPSLR